MKARTLLLLLVLTLATGLPVPLGVIYAAQFPSGQGQSSAFTGAWCAQGNPAKRCSIASNGAFLTLTNENGDTSTGQYRGSNGIVAPGWQFVTGVLSQDGYRINWSNGTYWTRCDDEGGGYRHRVNLTGTWYAQGNRSQSCSIQQRGKGLQLSNQQGSNATGQFDSKRHITTNWNGATIGGVISHDGNRINWDNGTYWIRYRLYSSQ